VQQGRIDGSRECPSRSASKSATGSFGSSGEFAQHRVGAVHGLDLVQRSRPDHLACAIPRSVAIAETSPRERRNATSSGLALAQNIEGATIAASKCGPRAQSLARLAVDEPDARNRHDPSAMQAMKT